MKGLLRFSILIFLFLSSCKEDEMTEQVKSFMDIQECSKEIPNILSSVSYDINNKNEEVLCIVDSECSFCIARFIKLYQTIHSIDKTKPLTAITNDSISLRFYIDKTIPNDVDKISIYSYDGDFDYVWNGFCYHIYDGKVLSSMTNPY